MKLYNSTSGQWSDYIAGGIIPGSNWRLGMPMILSVQEQRRIKKNITEVVRDCTERNPDKEDETLKEFGLSMTDLV